MCGVCMDTSVHQLSDSCVESVCTHLYTSCQTDVWSLYSDIFTPDIRLISGICMETSVNQLSNWCVESVWTNLYTKYQTDAWSLYGHICTQDNRLKYGICSEIFVHEFVRLLCGVCMDPSVHKLSDWCVESVLWHFYTRYLTDVWSLYGDICTQVFRVICRVSMDTSVHKL
jgi:hypothetical protein